MNSQDSEKIANLNLRFISLAQDSGALWRTKLGRSVHKTATRIVKGITEIIGKGNLDALLDLEKNLQQIDSRDAKTELETNSVNKAIADYKQIGAVVAQMRRSPTEYVLANESMQPDGTKQPQQRGPNQIRANIARLNNRNSFPSPEYQAIWEARIKLAKATLQKLAELHEATIARYNETLDCEVIDETAGNAKPPARQRPKPKEPKRGQGNGLSI